MPYIPYLLWGVGGAVVGAFAGSKLDDLIKPALVGGAVYLVYKKYGK
jgi:hypothetical protein